MVRLIQREYQIIRITLSIGVVLALSSLFGCAARIHYTLAPADEATESACLVPEHLSEPEQIVGVALSGGGSRAAVFGAASLEALWEHGLIDLVTHISSVSGGSLASSYFMANQPACDALNSDAETEVCWRDFFQEFKQVMRSNFSSAMVWRQLATFRGFSNTRLSSSLQDVVDKEFLHDMSFGDLADLSASANSDGQHLPVLLINAASYDDGRRFVFSNQCLSDSDQETTSDIAGNPLNEKSVRALTFSRPECNRPVPRDVPVSLAVATSAAVPGAMGPVTYEVPSTCVESDMEYWHLGDGGLFDNSGVDTLEEVVLREHNSGSGSLDRALIISVFAGQHNDEDELRDISNFWLIKSHTTRVVGAYDRRAQGYHDLLWEKLQGELSEQDLRVEKIEFNYSTAQIDHWPESCKESAEAGQQDPQTIRTAIATKLKKIKTSLKIPDCDADLLELAAHDVVDRQLNSETMVSLRAAGFQIRETQIED